MGKWCITSNREGAVMLSGVPRFNYVEFFDDICAFLSDPACHCVSFFAIPADGGLLFMAFMANDGTGEVYIGSCMHDSERDGVLPSLTALFPAMHPYEREIAENYGIEYADNPWNKPLRFAHDRADRSKTINNYPFYSIESDSLHEVNVGPIHAGIIEPGVFRFICNGEEVIHLEIVLGFQHRGIERLIRETPNMLRQTLLAETIAGDTAAGHASAFCYAIEKLAGFDTPAGFHAERTVALELERTAMHIADTGALCMDIGYQLGQVACEALRTIVINTTQLWCGNRFAKGLVRPFGTYYPLTEELCGTIEANIANVERRYREVIDNIRSTPSVLSRFEDCGVVSKEQALRIGAVGMAARACGAGRDIRTTHPWGVYGDYEPVTFGSGDVLARLNVRAEEVFGSLSLIRSFVKKALESKAAGKPDYGKILRPDSVSFSLVEGWRGEICHVAVTDKKGDLAFYKIKDPSMHNWMALALSVRGGGISDFPICNKSFNLSYCGHDL